MPQAEQRTTAIRDRQTSAGECPSGVPSTVIRPSPGSYSRVISLISVVFPTPLAPTIAVHFPASILRSRPSKTRRSRPG